MNSKSKGKRGELELVRKLKEYGYQCKRSVQYCGANGDADVIGLPGIHIECKRVERLNIYEAMVQAESDKAANTLPVVFHRKNNHPWLVTMDIEDWIQIYREWEAGKALEQE